MKSSDDSSINQQRRAVTLGALAMPMALAAGNSRSAATSGTDPVREMIIVNSLGALFDEGAPLTPEQIKRRLSVTVENYPEMVTERSLGYAREAGMTAVNITLGYVDGPV